MRNTTVLNSNYTYLSNISWQRGIILLLNDKATLIEAYDDEHVRATNGGVFSIPRIILLKRYIKLPNRMYRPNRRNIFVRDNYTCAYCLSQPGVENLSIDHIIPKSRGGKETWANLITACKDCNCRKGDRTPEEANIKILIRGGPL